MKVHFQRPTALLLALVLSAGLLVLPASAVDSPVDDVGSFWNHIASQAPDWLGTVMGAFYPSVCPNSDDSKHHGKVIRPGDSVGAWWARCDYCSQEFKVYDDDMQNAYNEHVNKVRETYGTSIIDSDGSGRFYFTDWQYYIGTYSSYSDAVPSTWASFSATVNPLSFSGIISESQSPCVVFISSEFRVLDTGNYRFFYPPSQIYGAIGCSGSIAGFGASAVWQVMEGSDYVSGSQYWTRDKDVSQYFVDGRFTNAPLKSGHAYRLCWQIPVYTYSSNVLTSFSASGFPYMILPDIFSGSGDVVSSGSRVGNISGNFGYYVNGDLVTTENTTIVNETTNTYTNPETGTTSTITDWTYDYSDRSYNITLETGDTVNVTYGDENVTIKEGDTTYNIYYIVQGGGDTPTPSPTPSPDVHEHTYTSVVTTEPSCLTSGLRTYTCSECGDTYTEKIPATGHTWVVERVVNTVYDPVYGNLVTQGYTIYQCSVCGEQYRDDNGSGPPGGGGSSGGDEEGGGFLDWLGKKLGELLGSIGDGIIGLLQTALGKILDGLIGIVNMISEKLNIVVEAIFKVFDEIPGIFTGFTDFMSAVFAFVPPEIITIITFGILAVVLVAIIKKFIG